MSILLFSRLRLPTLLLAALVPCLAVSRAAGGMLSALDPAQVALSALVQSQGVTPEPFTNLPGTPYPFTNPGGATIIIAYTAYSATPVPISGSNIFDISTTLAGDIVFLLDPEGSNDPSNWSAVFRFLNPNDPTGTQGLAADDVEGFDASNVGPSGFAGFQLLPNTVYLADTQSDPGNHFTIAPEFGPDGGIPYDQVALLGYYVDVTDSIGTGPGGNVPEPATWTAVLAGGAVLLVVQRRRTAPPPARLNPCNDRALPPPHDTSRITIPTIASLNNDPTRFHPNQFQEKMLLSFCRGSFDCSRVFSDRPAGVCRLGITQRRDTQRHVRYFRRRV